MSVAARIAIFSPKAVSAVPADESASETPQSSSRKSNGAGASLLKARRAKSTPRANTESDSKELAVVKPDDRVPRLRDQVKRCSLEIIDELLASPAGSFFAKPVDWEGLGLVDYPKVIFKPMDLGTVRVNVARGRWSTGEDISEGCNLTFNNAITYNESFDNDVLHAARECQAAFGRLYKARIEPLNAQIAHLLATSEAALVDAWAKQALGLQQQSPSNDHQPTDGLYHHSPLSSSPPQQDPKSPLPPWLRSPRSARGAATAATGTATTSPPTSKPSPPSSSKQPLQNSGFEPWKSPSSSSPHSSSSSPSSHNYSFSPNSPESPNASASFLPAAIRSRTTTSLPRPMASLTDHSLSEDDTIKNSQQQSSRRHRSRSSPNSLEIDNDDGEENEGDFQNGTSWTSSSSKQQKTSPTSADLASRNASMGRIGSLREQRRLLQAQVLRRMSQDDVLPGKNDDEENVVRNDESADGVVDAPASSTPLKQDQASASDAPLPETTTPTSPPPAASSNGKKWRSLGSSNRRHQRSAGPIQDGPSSPSQSKLHIPPANGVAPLSSPSSSSSATTAAPKAKVESSHPAAAPPPPASAAAANMQSPSSFQPRSYLPPPPKTSSTENQAMRGSNNVNGLLSPASPGIGRGRRSQSVASVLPQTSTLYSSNTAHTSSILGDDMNQISNSSSSGGGYDRSSSSADDNNSSSSNGRGPKSVAAILQGLGLGDFVEGFEAEGFLFEEDILAVGEAEALEVGREVGMKRGHLVRLARWVKDPKARHAAENRVAQASADAALELAKQEFALMVDQARRDLGAFCANNNANNNTLYGGDSSGGGGDAAKLVAVVAKRVGAAEAQQTSDHATLVEELNNVHKAISRLEMAQTRDRKDWLSSLQGVATRVEQLASQQQHDAHDLAAKMGALRSDVDDAAATTAASLNQAGVAQKAAVEKLGLSLGSTLSRMVERRLEELRHLQAQEAGYEPRSAFIPMSSNGAAAAAPIVNAKVDIRADDSPDNTPRESSLQSPPVETKPRPSIPLSPEEKRDSELADHPFRL